MVCFDAETTCLVAPEAAPIEQQPYLLEFAAIKLEERPSRKSARPTELVETTRMEFICNPRVAIPLDSIKITGITNEMVSGKPPFVAYLPALVDFFLGERIVVAHNLPFDINVLRYELQRLGRVTSFPWPPTQVCTVEKTLHFKGHRLNLGDMHELLTGEKHTDAHRAMKDVEALVRCVVELRKRGVL